MISKTPQPAAVSLAMGPAQWGMLICLAAIWSGSFLFIAVALKGLPPLTLVAARVGLAALMLWSFIRLKGHRLPRDLKSWRPLFMMGLLNNALPFGLIVWGQTGIESGLAAILNATTPLSTVILAHFFTSDEKLTAHKLAGVLLGLIGVAVMLGPSLIGGLSRHLLGGLAVIMAGMSYACAGIYGRRLSGSAPLVNATGMLVSSSVVMIPLALIFDQPWHLPLPGLVPSLALLALAGPCTALAYVLYFRILAVAGANNLMLVTLLVPVGAVILGHQILGETVLARHLAGMGLISLSLIINDGRLLGRLKPQRSRA